MATYVGRVKNTNFRPTCEHNEINHGRLDSSLLSPPSGLLQQFFELENAQWLLSTAMKAPRSHSSRLKLYYIQFPPKAATMLLLAHRYIRSYIGTAGKPQMRRPIAMAATAPSTQTRKVYESIRATSNQPFEAIDNSIMTNPSICSC